MVGRGAPLLDGGPGLWVEDVVVRVVPPPQSAVVSGCLKQGVPMTDYFAEAPSMGLPSFEECYNIQRAKKQRVLEELDQQMVFRYKAGMDYSRFKWRKAMLLQRINEKANAMFLSLQRSAVN